MITYKRKINYYETDCMGITHHSNYIRFMEEARIYFLEKIGHNYKELEKKGFLSPVIDIKCQYKANTTFDDIIEIQAGIIECTKVKFTLTYTMIKNKKIVFTGQSTHCFLNSKNQIIRLQKELPELYKSLCENKI